MNREAHVRFCESAGLRCPALLTYLCDYQSFEQVIAHLPHFTDQVYNSTLAFDSRLSNVCRLRTKMERGCPHASPSHRTNQRPAQNRAREPRIQNL
jgi:hypothetical protein